MNKINIETMNKQELLFAQKAVYSAGKHLADAGMRIRETERGNKAKITITIEPIKN